MATITATKSSVKGNTVPHSILTPSPSAWNSDDAKIDDAHAVSRLTAKLGPQDLTYGKIHNFEIRRCCYLRSSRVTSLRSGHCKDLTKPFGTLKPFIEKLDYLKALGV